MTLLKYFLCILGAALISSCLGGLFGAFVSVVSPEFVKELFSSHAENLSRYAAAVGMIWGLFLGTGVMGFCVFVYAFFNWLRDRNATSKVSQ